MFTPLQHQDSYSLFSSYRNFNITLNDVCENYFYGHRSGEKDGYHDSWWLTTLRICSFMTLIIPLLFIITYIITSYLISVNNGDDWRDKIYLPDKCQSQKEKYIEMFSRSGLISKDLAFDRYYFLACGNSRGSRVFAADGHFSSEAPLEGENALVIFIDDGIWGKTALAEKKRIILDTEPELHSPAIVVTVAGVLDGPIPSHKLSNRLKEVIVVESKKLQSQIPK